MSEYFKNIACNPSYKVSVLGNVKNSKGLVLAPRKQKNGYVSVQLYSHGEGRSHYIHRLVAENFIPNPARLKEINHKDGDKLNNKKENPEWCTRSHNIKEAHRTGLRKAPFEGLFGKDHNRSKPLIQKNIDGTIVKRRDSLMDCKRANPSYSIGNISTACNSSEGTYKGYRWEYE
jgi:hypothetical protein